MSTLFRGRYRDFVRNVEFPPSPTNPSFSSGNPWVRVTLGPEGHPRVTGTRHPCPGATP